MMARLVMKHSLKFGLKINSAKTKVVTVNGEGLKMIEEETTEDVWKLRYLGSTIAPDNISQNEISIRLALARGATSDLNNSH